MKIVLLWRVTDFRFLRETTGDHKPPPGSVVLASEYDGGNRVTRFWWLWPLFSHIDGLELRELDRTPCKIIDSRSLVNLTPGEVTPEWKPIKNPSLLPPRLKARPERLLSRFESWEFRPVAVLPTRWQRFRRFVRRMYQSFKNLFSRKQQQCQSGITVLVLLLVVVVA